MTTLHPTTQKHSLKIFLFTLFLALALGYLAVPAAKADLPPETYYQGIDTGLNGDDVGSAALPIGFDFTFFGNSYTQFYVSSNGYISFDDRDLRDYTNDDIGNGRNPDNYIAPFWDDTTAYNGLNQYVYYKTLGTAPNRQLVVQYTNVGFWNDPTPLGTFSVILYEGSNNIQFQYRYLVGANARTHGASATVGLENYDGTDGTRYSFDTESLTSEQVILFTPNGSNYEISTAPYAGILLGAGDSPPPDIPVQTTPLQSSIVSQTPTFSWGASANADYYELRVDNNANMGSLALNPTNITETSFTPSTPLPEDSYYWIVIAHNATDSSWSEQWVFTTSSNPPPPLPDTPLLTSPVQDEANVSLSPTFSWQTTPGTDTYHLFVSENSDLSAPLIDQAGLTGTSFDAAGLNEDTVYYWSIIASNATGSSQSSTRNFTTLHINTAPTAVSDNFTVAEDSQTTQLDVLANDSDPDSLDVLSISAVSTPDNGGTAVRNNNHIDYTPAPNFFGTESFSYTIEDGNGGSDTATVTIIVSSVNDMPVANDDTKTLSEDSPATFINVLVNDNDPDTADSLTLTAVSTPNKGGTAVISNNKISYTPAPNFFGTETFTYTIEDGNGGSDIATVTVTINSVNDLPTATNDSASVADDGGTIQINVLDNDSDLDTDDILAISAVGTPDNGGTAVITNNQIEYTAAANFVGTEMFTYTISDGNGGSDTATVTVTVFVSSSNTAPTAEDDTPETPEDTAIVINVLANDSDPDGDSLTILNVSSASHGTAVIKGTAIKYTPNPNFFGTDSFSYTLSDGEFTDTATVTITVASVNDLPQANLDTASTTAVSTVVISVLDNDTDPIEGSALTIVAVANPAHGTAVTDGTTITYTPAPGFVGTETFTYTVSDGLDSVTGTITVTVTPCQLFIPFVNN